MVCFSRSFIVRAFTSLCCTLFFTSTHCALAETVDMDSNIAVSGNVANISNKTTCMGFDFRVRFSDIQYKGQVHRVVITQQEGDRIRVAVAMRHVVLSIRQTNITGSRHSASCGPMEVTLGTSRDLWLNFDVQMDVSDRYQLVDSKFSLAADNFQVGSPGWVRAKGMGMTQSRVISNLKSGIVDNRATIEQKLSEKMPSIFAQVREEMDQQIKVAALTN